MASRDTKVIGVFSEFNRVKRNEDLYLAPTLRV